MRGPGPSCRTGKPTSTDILCLAVAALLWSGPPAAAEPTVAPDRLCHVRTPAFDSPLALPRTAAALRDGKALTVVALGSSSTQGFGATAPEKAYPAQLAMILGQHFPRSPITVLNRGVGGDTADKMLARLNRDVFAAKPDLVIWQTGTNDAIRLADPVHFMAVLNVGVRLILAHGIDLMLMDPQYAPRYVAAPRFRDFVETMRQVAGEHRVALFRRFEATKAWTEDARFSPVKLTTTDGLHPTDANYRCTAVLLAEELIRAAAE
ncbi:MAG TPA: SGNH/GDSL hydrolase family protein [Rhodospirillaceae bacterium]|nr:SGNH/GDSL hydrolase family protein [Rhodospirillaceae bacterium]